MKLEYKILWLDDKIDDFIDDGYIEEIEEHLIDEEFNPFIDKTNNQQDFYTYLNKNNYDLILTDFHLNEENNGDDVVETIRNKNGIFTEILFYTAKADLKGSLTWDRISFLETATLPNNHHEEVIEKIKKLINLTIEKFHDIVVMRGMIMNETSDLDALQLEILNKYIKQKAPADTNQLKCDILEKINAHFNKKLECVNGDWKSKENGFKKLMKDTFVFSSDYKIQTLSKVLQDINLEDFSEAYRDEIITIRNIFAHVTLQKDTNEDGRVTRRYFKYKNDGITFDSAYCKKIRKNINTHKINLDTLNKKLNE
jgi:CheY-like chemotaxis protein